MSNFHKTDVKRIYNEDNQDSNSKNSFWRKTKKSIKSQDIFGFKIYSKFLWVLIFLIVNGIIFIAFGIGFLFSYRNAYGVLVRYDNTCSGISSCTVTFTLSQDIENAMLYYRIDGFYGNHKNYMKSRSFSQLRGNSYSDGKCTPIVTNSDIGSPKSIVTGSTLTSSDTAYPWGLIAKYIFTDSFSIKDSSGNTVTLDETNIALNIDQNTRFKNTNNKSQQWLDFTNQHFMNWERIETFPWFDKLYAKISTKLKAGVQYTVTIQNNYNYSSFDIKKSFVISSTSGLGDNLSLPIIFLAMGGFIIWVLIPLQCILEILKYYKKLHAFKKKNEVSPQPR